MLLYIVINNIFGISTLFSPIKKLQGPKDLGAKWPLLSFFGSFFCLHFKHFPSWLHTWKFLSSKSRGTEPNRFIQHPWAEHQHSRQGWQVWSNTARAAPMVQVLRIKCFHIKATSDWFKWKHQGAKTALR